MNQPATHVSTILCIDDEMMIRRNIVDYLEDSGYRVLEARNGEEGLEILKKEHPQLVLLDLRISGLSGIDVLKIIKEVFPEIGVIIISGQCEMQDAIDALRAGAWDFLTKPITDMAILLNTVQKAIARSDTNQKDRAYEKNLEERIRVKAEALQESEEKYRTLYHNSKDAFMILGTDETILSGNPSTVHMFGCRNEAEFISKRPADLSPTLQPDGSLSVEKASKMIAIALENGSHFFEWKHKRVTGEEFFATVLLTKMQLKGKVFLQATVRDITEQKRTEEQLRQAQKMEIVGTLASGLAHDFNNVLGGIVGALSLMNYKLQQHQSIKTEELEDYIEMMSESSKRATIMVKQLLALSREQEMSFTSVDLNNVVKKVLKICRSTLDKSVKLDPHYTPQPAIVGADPAQMEQVLLNFCVNASHAMTFMRSEDEPWGGTLTISIDKIFADRFFREVHPEAREKNYWILSVKDTGVGMSSTVISKIFNPFFTTKDKGLGTGLGLSMVYNIVKQHHGFIDIYSEVGMGSTFSVYLPVLEGEVIIEESEPVMHDIPVGEGIILLVEDEKIMQLVAKKILEECGYQVMIANNGREGADVFSVHHSKISLVVLDLAMPEMSGKESYIAMKKIDPNVKALLVSGFRLDERVENIMELGINGFIQKPFTLEKLAAAIDHILGKK